MFRGFFRLLLLVSPCGGRVGARDAVLVHRLDVAHVAEANRWTGHEDVPVQSRRAEEQWIGLLVVGDAAPGWVVPAGVARGAEGKVVIQKVGRAAIKARLSPARRAPAKVVVVVEDVVDKDVVIAPYHRSHAAIVHRSVLGNGDE